ncbi:MAG: TonB-dependent receptor plug domain-containing protein [Selenomonas artemidis]
MKKQLLQAAIITAILSGINGVVSAGGEQDASKLDEYTLDDVVVTAQRVETRDLDTPATTTVITEQQLKDSGAVTAYEALERVPGLNSSAYGHGGEQYGGMFSRLSVRGLDRGTLLLIDGTPANLLNYNSMLNSIPVDAIEKIEIVKGAGSVLYGAEAMGGVINIITKKPEGKKVQGHVTGAVGSYDKNYGVMVGNEHVIFSYRRDYRKPVHQTSRIFFKTPTTTTTRKSREAGTKDSAFLSLRITDKLTATYAYNDTDSTTNEYDYQPALRDWSKLKASRRYHYRQQRVGVTYDDADRQWHSKFAWIRQEVRPMTKDASSDTNSNAYHFEVQKAWNFREGKDSLVGGLEFHRENYLNNVKTEAHLERDSYAAFFSYTRRLSNRFSATLGMREHIVKKNTYERRQNVFLPQIQTVYKITPKASWYVNIGKSFEMPAVNSWFTKRNVFKLYPMKPQVGWNYETGVKFGDNKESLRVAVFRMAVKNQFVWAVEEDPVTHEKFDIQTNGDEFRNIGIELEYHKQITPNLQARIGGYYANPRAREKGEWRQSDAHQQYFAGLLYRKDKLRISTDWYVTAGRQWAYYTLTGKTASGKPDHKIPNRIEGQLTMSYEVTPDQTLSFGVYNILNRENPIIQHEYWSLPRNYRLSYTYRF